MENFRKLIASVLAVLLCASLSPVAFAMEDNIGVQVVSFSDLARLDVNESVEQSVIDFNGNRAVVGVEKMSDNRSLYTVDSTWRVWFAGVTINAEFYMTVSENKVTSVFDDTISVIGGKYEDDELTMTSAYGKLDFKATSLAGIMSAKCWLKGTVTGSDNEIDVTWKM